jgi:hypothetical protein
VSDCSQIGTGSSNSLRSANESQVEAFSGEVRKLRACRGDAHGASATATTGARSSTFATPPTAHSGCVSEPLY